MLFNRIASGQSGSCLAHGVALASGAHGVAVMFSSSNWRHAVGNDDFARSLAISRSISINFCNDQCGWLIGMPDALVMSIHVFFSLVPKSGR